MKRARQRSTPGTSAERSPMLAAVILSGGASIRMGSPKALPPFKGRHMIDHPLISSALVQELIEQFYKTKSAIVLPVYEGRRGHPVIFSASLYDELLRGPLETGARAVVWAHKGEIEEVRTNEEGCVLNLNDPETMNTALRQKN